jgi:hypothetical protein
MIVDRAAIFSELCQRNALRKANGLPLLDVPSEYAHQVAISAQRDFHTAYDLHAEKHLDAREAFRQQVHSEYRAQNGAERAETMAGRWIISRLVQQRFEAYVAKNYSLPLPDRATVRHTFTYGDCSSGKD